jgi:hypothetical protein
VASIAMRMEELRPDLEYDLSWIRRGRHELQCNKIRFRDHEHTALAPEDAKHAELRSAALTGSERNEAIARLSWIVCLGVYLLKSATF